MNIVTGKMMSQNKAIQKKPHNVLQKKVLLCTFTSSLAFAVQTKHRLIVLSGFHWQIASHSYYLLRKIVATFNGLEQRFLSNNKHLNSGSIL